MVSRRQPQLAALDEHAGRSTASSTRGRHESTHDGHPPPPTGRHVAAVHPGQTGRRTPELSVSDFREQRRTLVTEGSRRSVWNTDTSAGGKGRSMALRCRMGGTSRCAQTSGVPLLPPSRRESDQGQVCRAGGRECLRQVAHEGARFRRRRLDGKRHHQQRGASSVVQRQRSVSGPVLP